MNSNNRIMPPVHKNTVTQRGSKALKVLVQAHIINSVDTSLVRKDVFRTEACGEKKAVSAVLPTKQNLTTTTIVVISRNTNYFERFNISIWVNV